VIEGATANSEGNAKGMVWWKDPSVCGRLWMRLHPWKGCAFHKTEVEQNLYTIVKTMT